MSKEIPVIQKFMTYNPIGIDANSTFVQARKLMAGENVRHLPVMENGRVVGIISDRDLKLVLDVPWAAPENIKVKDIANKAVYSVSPHTPIDQVADEMASKHYGCAVVEDNHKLVGIFTTVDALKAISDICHQRYHVSH